MDFTLSPEQTAFRYKVRTGLKDNLPSDWANRRRTSTDIPRPDTYEFMRDWQRKMHEAGLVGLTWPR